MDVWRGTFTGEMSWLAMLSSEFPTYLDAVHDLVCLYVKRGYPMDLVNAWVRKYLQTRWEQRLSNKPVSSETESVLVLKTHYNPTWNYFSTKELGDTILG